MRQFLILFFLLFCSQRFYAQNYVAFPIDSARWKVTYTSSASQCPYLVAEFQDAMVGDTLIGSINYKKIFRSGVIYSQMCFPSVLGYVGCIREDANKHIYYRLPFTSSDTIIYDFNLNIGDTLKGYLAMCSPIIVDSIDSVLVQSTYRKRFNCSTHSLGPCYSNIGIIEGIGGTQGLLMPFGNSEAFSSLDCFSLLGNTIYPDTTTNCPLLFTEISETSIRSCLIKRINSQDNSVAEFTNEDNPCLFNSVWIYNEMGQLIISKTDSNLFPCVLSSKEIGTGVFFSRFTNNLGESITLKFVLQ